MTEHTNGGRGEELDSGPPAAAQNAWDDPKPHAAEKTWRDSLDDATTTTQTSAKPTPPETQERPRPYSDEEGGDVQDFGQVDDAVEDGALTSSNRWNSAQSGRQVPKPRFSPSVGTKSRSPSPTRTRRQKTKSPKQSPPGSPIRTVAQVQLPPMTLASPASPEKQERNAKEQGPEVDVSQSNSASEGAAVEEGTPESELDMLSELLGIPLEQIAVPAISIQAAVLCKADDDAGTPSGELTMRSLPTVEHIIEEEKGGSKTQTSLVLEVDLEPSRPPATSANAPQQEDDSPLSADAFLEVLHQAHEKSQGATVMLHVDEAPNARTGPQLTESPQTLTEDAGKLPEGSEQMPAVSHGKIESQVKDQAAYSSVDPILATSEATSQPSSQSTPANEAANPVDRPAEPSLSSVSRTEAQPVESSASELDTASQPLSIHGGGTALDAPAQPGQDHQDQPSVLEPLPNAAPQEATLEDAQAKEQGRFGGDGLETPEQRHLDSNVTFNPGSTKAVTVTTDEAGETKPQTSVPGNSRRQLRVEIPDDHPEHSPPSSGGASLRKPSISQIFEDMPFSAKVFSSESSGSKPWGLSVRSESPAKSPPRLAEKQPRASTPESRHAKCLFPADQPEGPSLHPAFSQQQKNANVSLPAAQAESGKPQGNDLKAQDGPKVLPKRMSFTEFMGLLPGWSKLSSPGPDASAAQLSMIASMYGQPASTPSQDVDPPTPSVPLAAAATTQDAPELTAGQVSKSEAPPREDHTLSAVKPPRPPPGPSDQPARPESGPLPDGPEDATPAQASAIDGDAENAQTPASTAPPLGPKPGMVEVDDLNTTGQPSEGTNIEPAKGEEHSCRQINPVLSLLFFEASRLCKLPHKTEAQKSRRSKLRTWLLFTQFTNAFCLFCLCRVF